MSAAHPGQSKTIAEQCAQLRRERDELATALRVYLNAGDKETRAAAAVIAKAALAKVTP